jgi:CubicO group peptidase (beta-lactamase class C family)
MSPDEYVQRLAELPLLAQPGTAWHYAMASDLLGVLLARAAGRSLGALLAERVTGPLDLHDTAFSGDPARLAGLYAAAGEEELTEVDPPDGVFARPPAFEGLNGGLVSTAADLLAFLGALADGGAPLLRLDAVARMSTDRLDDRQRRSAAAFLGPGRSWGLQVGVDTADSDAPFRRGGRWGWDGGTGTSAWVDPARGLVAVLLTQRLMSGPQDEPHDFWQALDACP